MTTAQETDLLVDDFLASYGVKDLTHSLNDFNLEEEFGYFLERIVHYLDEDVVQHYGVKGMKWGKRKAAREGPSADAAQAIGIHTRVAAQKSTTMLSNKELKDAIERMRLEQQYSQMSGGLDLNRRQKAKKWIGELLDGVGDQQVRNLANDQVKDMVDQTLKQGKHDPVTKAERQQKVNRLKKTGAM